MEEYPEELRTPPVSLISLVGCPELHSLISTHLHSEQPPINTLALPDFSAISIMNRFNKEIRDPVAGILKKDWLLKHRTRVPAVVAALFTSDHVSGDPAQWLELCTHVENLKYRLYYSFCNSRVFWTIHFWKRIRNYILFLSGWFASKNILLS